MPESNKDDLRSAIVALKMLIIHGDEEGAYNHIDSMAKRFEPSSLLFTGIGDAFQDLGDNSTASQYYKDAFGMATGKNKKEILTKLKDTEESKSGDVELTSTTRWGTVNTGGRGYG